MRQRIGRSLTTWAGSAKQEHASHHSTTSLPDTRGTKRNRASKSIVRQPSIDPRISSSNGQTGGKERRIGRELLDYGFYSNVIITRIVRVSYGSLFSIYKAYAPWYPLRLCSSHSNLKIYHITMLLHYETKQSIRFYFIFSPFYSPERTFPSIPTVPSCVDACT